eukprot:651975-Pelagomonas_calceolata.AAC.3
MTRIPQGSHLLRLWSTPALTDFVGPYPTQACTHCKALCDCSLKVEPLLQARPSPAHTYNNEHSMLRASLVGAVEAKGEKERVVPRGGDLHQRGLLLQFRPPASPAHTTRAASDISGTPSCSVPICAGSILEEGRG